MKFKLSAFNQAINKVRSREPKPEQEVEVALDQGDPLETYVQCVLYLRVKDGSYIPIMKLKNGLLLGLPITMYAKEQLTSHGVNVVTSHNGQWYVDYRKQAMGD